MSLYKYFQPTSRLNLPNAVPGVPMEVVVAANAEVDIVQQKNAQPGKSRGAYNYYSADTRSKIGAYAAANLSKMSV
jgi:hypothetical protein